MFQILVYYVFVDVALVVDVEVGGVWDGELEEFVVGAGAHDAFVGQCDGIFLGHKK